MKYKPAVLVLLFLYGCSSPQQHIVTTPTRLPTATVTATASPTAEGQLCAYVWAYQDLPEISKDLQSVIQETQPDGQARAQAYGENCVYEDGHATFSAMETDFYITFQVKSLDDPEEIGGLIVQTMNLIKQFPRGKIPGDQDGFAEFKFESGNNSILVRVPIDEYEKLPVGTNSTEVFHAFEK